MPTSCGPIPIWNATRAPRLIRGCGSGLTELALAGNRLAWIEQYFGETSADLGTTLRVVNLATGTQELYADAFLSDGVGTYLEGLRGQGSLLTVSLDTFAEPTERTALLRIATSSKEPGTQRCPHAEPAVPTGHLCVFVADEATPQDTAVENGRIVFAPPGGGLMLVDRDGRLGRRYAVDTAKAAFFALSGSSIVALRPDAVQVYDVATGTLIHDWPIRPASSYAQGPVSVGLGLVAFATGQSSCGDTTIVLMRLRDGAEARVCVAGQFGGVAAVLQPRGLFYLYSLWRRHRPHLHYRIAFFSGPRLLREFGRTAFARPLTTRRSIGQPRPE